MYKSEATTSKDLKHDLVNPELLKKGSNTQAKVKDIQAKLSIHKAAGGDGIPARMGKVPLICKKRTNITPVFYRERQAEG